MPDKPKPFIGVTGFMWRSEVKAALACVPENPSHLLMMGILVSDKTLEPELGHNSKPRRYPLGCDLGNIFVKDPRALNLVHFNTMQPEKLYEQMCSIDAMAVGYDGFQLNMTWPDSKILAKYKETHPGQTIVLQCGSKALDEVDRSGKLLAERLKEYNDSDAIDYVLVDPSGGEGQEFSMDLAIECFDYLNEVPHIGFGIVGGLGPNEVFRLAELTCRFPNFSIDAQGRLRDAKDNLHLPTVQEYLQNAYKVLGG